MLETGTFQLIKKVQYQKMKTVTPKKEEVKTETWTVPDHQHLALLHLSKASEKFLTATAGSELQESEKTGIPWRKDI